MKILFVFLLSTFTTVYGFTQSKSVISCKMWNPKSFCDIPDSLITIPRIINSKSTTVSFKTCEQIDKTEKKTGVWLTISTKDGTSINFKKDFENIKLIKKKDGTTIHPLAIVWPNEATEENKKFLQYMSIASTTGFTCKFSFQKKIDLIFIFSNAEKNDSLIIDGLIQAIIQE